VGEHISRIDEEKEMKQKETIVEKKLIEDLRNNILGLEDDEMGFLVRLRDG